ncbi:MAG TPA: acyl-ACP--UDP-N-acetylglucosamine O-acyltransferase [Lacunisphaera sp.]|nr:acyl-ACP--UDP-N-acetylglucosamine O-acyltransferase [Lacunisphaera sp.]
MSIHPTAIVEEGVTLGTGCAIHAHAIIKRGTVLGDGVAVHPFAVVGGDPNFLKFDPATVSGTRIGANTIIREHVTINRSIYAGKDTVVGARCYLMANAHVGHDCTVGDDVVLATNIMLGGHVDVGNFTFFGGGAGAHQFCRIGEGVMIAGLARITQDLAPFLLVSERNEVSGLNVVGLKRRGFSRTAIGEIKECYAAVFAGGDPRKLAAARSATAPEARRFLEFFAGGKRGFARPGPLATTDGGELE